MMTFSCEYSLGTVVKWLPGKGRLKLKAIYVLNTSTMFSNCRCRMQDHAQGPQGPAFTRRT